MSPGVHFGSGEGSAERLRGFVAGVRFLSFSGLKGPNSGPPRVVGSVDDSRGPFSRFVGSVVVCVEVFGTAQWHNLLVRGRFRRRSRRLRCRAR